MYATYHIRYYSAWAVVLKKWCYSTWEPIKDRKCSGLLLLPANWKVCQGGGLWVSFSAGCLPARLILNRFPSLYFIWMQSKAATCARYSHNHWVYAQGVPYCTQFQITERKQITWNQSNQMKFHLKHTNKNILIQCESIESKFCCAMCSFVTPVNTPLFDCSHVRTVHYGTCMLSAI